MLKSILRSLLACNMLAIRWVIDFANRQIGIPFQLDGFPAYALLRDNLIASIVMFHSFNDQLCFPRIGMC